MIFKNADVFYNGEFKKLDVKAENGLISEIGENLSSENSVDLTGKMLLPGLIDIHSHGCMGYDFSNSTIDEILSNTAPISPGSLLCFDINSIEFFSRVFN